MDQATLVKADPREQVVSVTGFSKRYRKQTAAQDVSLAIRRGEIYGLIGPDGAGKSSLMKSIAGVLTFDGGERLRRHFSRNPKWIHPISGAKNGRRVLPSAARARPASATALHFVARHGAHNDLTPCRVPPILSPPALPRGLRQNIRPYGYAGGVAHRSSAIAPSL
ncbi:MAG: ATP-binding cassette domain-containing protein, partial [Gammaproteobacteria bacterium]|nr:ATP-binding cassette domain-containing protein [Gammaproteobacteria bacterium]